MSAVSKKLLTREDGKPFFRIGIPEALDFIQCWWIGYTDLNQVMEGSELIIDYVVQSGKTGLLVDSSTEEGPWNDANKWIIEDWMPRAFSAGLTKIAIVLSEDIFSVMSAHDHAGFAKERGFNVELFETEKMAVQWLTKEFFSS